MDNLEERAAKLGFECVIGPHTITLYSGHLVCFVGSREKVIDLFNSIEKRRNEHAD